MLVIAAMSAALSLGEVCHAPMDLVFLLDSSASIRGNDFELCKNFMKTIVDRFDVGRGAHQVRTAEVNFANWAATNWKLSPLAADAAEVKARVDAMPARGAEGNGNTCVGEGMDMVSQQIVCNGCDGARLRESEGGAAKQSTVVIVITDGQPYCKRRYCKQFTPCACNALDFNFACQCCDEWGGSSPSRAQQATQRAQALATFHERADMVIAVGVGSRVPDAYMRTISKAAPRTFHVNNYAEIDTLLDSLAAAACPTLAPTVAPTAMPTTKPTTAVPTEAPTFPGGVCDAAEHANCDPTNGICACSDAQCLSKVCTCANSYICSPRGSSTCGTCAVPPSMAPTTGNPTGSPTAKPSGAPTLSPTTFSGFLNDNDDAADGQEATSPLAGDAPKTASMVAIGIAAIAGIVLAAVLAAIAAFVLLGGSAVFITKKLLFEVESDVISAGGTLEKGGSAVPVGQLLHGPPPGRPSGAPVGALCAPPVGATSIMPSLAETLGSCSKVVEMSDLPHERTATTLNPVALLGSFSANPVASTT